MTVAAAAALAAMLLAAGCGPAATVTREGPATAADSRDRVVVAVAMPVEETGLAGRVVAGFARQYPEYSIRVVGMDPSAAIAAARAGTADALVVPASPELAAFLKGGFASGGPLPLMTDSYVLVGPGADPVSAGSAPSIDVALSRIAGKAAGLSQPGQVPVMFFAPAGSTAAAALVASAWKRSGAADPRGGPWYTQVKGGPSAVVKAADKGNGYAIVDRATFMTLEPSLGTLKVVRSSGVAPQDVYVVVQAAGAQSAKAASAFTEWVAGSAGQSLVSNLGLAADGSPFFGRAGTP
jgi:ABC-type tungstate transport system permease subunit